MIDFLKNDTRVFAAIAAAVSVATLSGCGIGYYTAKNGPSIESRISNQENLVTAVRLVSQLTKKISPDLRAPVYYTDFDFVEELGHAQSTVKAKGCKVVLNNDLFDNDFVEKLRSYTGWDDKQAAIFIAAHELQHCVTKDDVRRAAYSKEALTDKDAEVLHAFLWGTEWAQDIARKPADPRAVHGVHYASTKDAYIRANESISDVTALIMLQQLSAGSITVETVEGLKKLRAEESPDPIRSSHHTVQALNVFITKLHLDDSFGKFIAPAHIAQVAYQIVGSAKPEDPLTKVTVDDLKKARNEYLAEHTDSTTMDM